MFAHTALRSLTASVVRSPRLLAATIGTQGGTLWKQQRLQTIQTIRSGLAHQFPALRRGYAQVPEDNPDRAKYSPSHSLPPPLPPPPPDSSPFIDDPHSRTFPSHDRGADTIPKSAYISSADRKRERIAQVSFTLFFLSLATAALYFTRNWDSEEDVKKHAEDAPNGYTPGMMYRRLRSRIRDITSYYEEPVFEKLLPDPLPPEYQPPYTLVLGLEDLLIHTEWDKKYGWRSAKRPGLDYFLGYMSMYFELVVFSDSPSHLVIPVAEKMGAYPGFVTQFLSREATRYKDGKYIKVRPILLTYCLQN